MRILLISFLLLISTALFAADAKKVALVIGNGAYQSATLKNPANDAKAIAVKLRELGFDVTVKTDVNQKDMSRAINDFGERVKLGSTALFYYAGHGIQVRGKNFLIPVDADIASEAGVRGESVDLDQVMDQLGTANVSLVILDACRNNPFETRFRRAGGAGLAQVDAPTGTLLAYATAPGKTAADGLGSNGLYTSALLKAMDSPGLKIEDVFKQVRNEVIQESANQQTPWESSSLTADFYFRPGNKTEVTTAKLNEMEKGQQELLQEMRKLKAELLAMKERSTPAITQTTLTSQQVAAVIPISPSPTPVEFRPEQSQQVALVQPSEKTATISQVMLGEWAERLAVLESAKGQLTLSKALALLLDIKADDDLKELIAHEFSVRSSKWANAFALGVDNNGELIWGSSHSWQNPKFATDSAADYCTRNPTDKCAVVLLNGDLDQKTFFEIVKMLGKSPLETVRKRYIERLHAKPLEFIVSLGGGADKRAGGFAPER